MYLYLITNTVNGKQYVGITTQPLATRWRDHLSKARRGAKTLIAQALRKYGQDAFMMTVLADGMSWEELTTMEQQAIRTYGTLVPAGYNLTLGGDGTLGRLHTDQAKQQISLKNRGRVIAAHVREAVSRRHRGVPKSLEHRQKIGNAQLGTKNHRYGTTLTEEHRQRLREVHTGNTYTQDSGYVMSDAVRAYLSALRTGTKHTLEARAKIAAAKVGKPRSVETKAKVSAGLKAYHATHANPMQGRTQSKAARALISAKARARSRGIHYDGMEYASIIEAMEATGLTRSQLMYRLKTGCAHYVDTKE